MSLAKIFIIVAFLGIVFVLFRGLKHMVKGRGNPEATVRSLTWRISLSVLLILLLIAGVATGLIEPHGVTP